MAESEASLDESLQLKKRARRRLVGATALVLAAAIVLPMVMDHEPRPVNQDIQVRIPTQDAGGGAATRILAARPAATPLPAPVAEAKPAPEPKAAVAETKPEIAAAKADAAAAKHDVKAEAPKAAAVPPAPAAAAKPAESHPSAKPAESHPAKPAEKPAEKGADKKAEEARATEALAGGAAEQWVIQLGAYKEAGNVKLLLSKLKGIGLSAFTEEFNSPQGPRTRVRAGPFASREAAEKARTKVKIIGVDGPVAPK